MMYNAKVESAGKHKREGQRNLGSFLIPDWAKMWRVACVVMQNTFDSAITFENVSTSSGRQIRRSYQSSISLCMSCINCPRRSLRATQTLNSSLCLQVGFFPSQCVEVIGDKTDGQTPLPATSPSPHMTPGMFNLDSISLLKLCRFLFNGPSLFAANIVTFWRGIWLSRRQRKLTHMKLPPAKNYYWQR